MVSIVGAVLDILIACLCLHLILLCLFINFDVFQRERLRGRQGEAFLSREFVLFCFFFQQLLGHVSINERFNF